MAACAPPSEDAARKSADGLSVIPLSLETREGRFDYDVEVAETPKQQAQGLMFRQDLAPTAGMLFPFTPPRPASFWMRNTYVPLDIIFLKGGRIESIARNAVPLVETARYQSLGIVDAVLELNAGEADRIGADKGDLVVYTLP